MDDAVAGPPALPIEPAAVERVRRLMARFAVAADDESRARRRLDRVLRGGRPIEEAVRRLDQAAARVAEIADEIEAVVAGEPSEPATRQAVGPDAHTRSDDDAPTTDPARPAQPRGEGPAPSRRQRPARRGASATTIAGAIDVGSNSVHLLVAVVRGHRLQPLVDVSEFLGLGVAVDREGNVGEGLSRQVVETVAEYVRDARTLGAERVTIVGTDPLRRAANGPQVAAAIGTATAAEVAIVDHEEEALLTLLGVTAGRPVVRDLVLVDIGGGSSEILIVAPAGEARATGLPIGSARLAARFAEHDPPTAGELDAMIAAARAVLAGAPDAVPLEVVIVGGTASNLLRVLPAAAIDRVVTRHRLAEALAILAAETASESAARHGMRETRARVMPAGAAIVAGILERYGVDRARVSEAGIREGTLLATVHGGAGWRRHLEWLAHGWSRSAAVTSPATALPRTPSERRQHPTEPAPEGHPGHASPRPTG